MLTVALQHCGLDPSFAIGGDLATSGSGAHEGTGEIFVAEADESDASFLAFSPEVAIVTNVEADHLDHYGTPAAYVAAFGEFLGRIMPGGMLVACVDDPGAAALAETARGARDPGAPLRAGATEATARLVAFRPDGPGAPDRPAPRRHGAPSCGWPSPASTWRSTRWPRCSRAWSSARPPKVSWRGSPRSTGCAAGSSSAAARPGVAVYDDYAHHPTKVAAQLRAARDVAGTGRVVVAFQPHLYSRTRDFAREFGAALGLADEVVVLDVYGAREDPEPGVSGALVAERCRCHPSGCGSCRAGPTCPRSSPAVARPGDLVITMGAGDVTVLAPEILLELAR